MEKLVREFVEEWDTVYVVTGPVLRSDLNRLGKSRIAVPEYFYKVLLRTHNGDTAAVGFLLPNARDKNNRIITSVSVDEVERMTRLDFFFKLPDETEARVEAMDTYDNWLRVSDSNNSRK